MTIHKKLLAAAATGALALGSLAGLSASARADIIHADDVIIQFSLCVGNDCVNGENFGFDTIRLKENNTRIQFDDTSVGSFPTRNWQLRANSSSSGGASFFGIVDQGATGNSETGTIVFAVEAAAPANSLYVESDGDVGLGTSTPVVNLHIKDGNTPTLRLEQDGSSGFTPQTWDVAGNEANFFVRDVTNGSLLSFRIRPGAPTSSIDIASDGDVGIGTSNPDINNAGDDLVVFDASGPARLALYNGSAGVANNVWTFNSNNTLRISSGLSPPELELQTNGNMELGGTCIELDANNATRFACTFSAGGGVSCLAAGSSCP